MDEKKQKVTTLIGMWLAALVGSVYGIYYTVIGFFTNSGPGGGLEGPTWKVILSGVISALLASYVGELMVRRLSKKKLDDTANVALISLRAFLTLLVAGIVAFIVGWEVGFIIQRLFNLIPGLGWTEVLLYGPLMGFIYGVPFSAGAALIYVLVIVFLKPNKS